MPIDSNEIKRLKLVSANIRLDVLKTLRKIGYGHLGGSLSIVETLSAIYGKHLRFDPKNPNWSKRDMVVLSKGHAGPALYSTLANFGFFPKEILETLNAGGTILPSHPDRTKTPGVDATTGSLGQGTSVAAGLAYGFRLNKTDQVVYLIVGDGELDEGQCWEAFQFIAHNKLGNCIVFIDVNKKQLDGWTKDIINPFDIAKKMESFGFKVWKVKGDDEGAISNAIEECKAQEWTAVCIVLDTVKGQGVKYFEDYMDNHSVKFNTDENKKAADDAIKNLEAFIAKGGV
ncbi:MAG: transketolase [Elusimicrobiota bacterium]|jgi:transketolase|nr:transketolase [Elusimicrobiota bacterium]